MHTSLLSLVVPIAVTGVALFFASFLSWMVFKLHWKDWRKLPDEDAFLEPLKKQGLKPGGYMMPGCNHPSEYMSEEFQKKAKENPKAIMTVLPEAKMGANMALTTVYFLVIAYFLAYLAAQAFHPGETFLNVFQFVFTASLPIFCGAIVSNAIWFRQRVTGYLVESVFYAAVAAAIFAGLWPGK
jgi:hypothetical protein